MTAARENHEAPQPHLAIRSGDVAPRVILVRTAAQADRFAAQLAGSNVRASNRQYHTITGRSSGGAVSIASTGLGGPSVAIAIEELRRVGARAMVLVDVALAPPDAPLGEVVLATGAVRSDGTSREYFPLELPAVADFPLYVAVRRAAAARQVTAVEGLVRSVDRLEVSAPHAAESGPRVAAIDMATALAYTLAQRHRCPVVSLLRTVSLAQFAAVDDSLLDPLFAVAIGGLASWELPA